MRRLFCYMVIMLILSSCATTYTYISNVVNVPMLDSNREIQASGYFGFDHSELQTSYSPTNHFVTMANGYIGVNNQSFVEGGCGYYGNFARNQFIEFIGGYGYGNINVKDLVAEEFTGNGRHYPLYLGEWENNAYYSAFANYHRFFTQASYGLIGEDSRNLRIALTCRASYAYYPHYYFEYYMKEFRSQHIVNSDTLSIYNFSSAVIEPALTVKFRGEMVCIIVQAGFAFPLSDYYSSHILHPIVSRRYFATGIQIYLHARKKNKLMKL